MTSWVYIFTTILAFMLHLSHRAETRRDQKRASEVAEEKRLFRKLMHNYEKSVRPVKNSSNPVIIILGTTLTQIFDMDERNQVLTVNVWLDQSWHDDNLMWDPDEYGGIKILRIPCDKIWLPDIVLYNSVDDYTEPYMRSLAMIQADGTVFWPPIVRFRSSCKVDITYFPFDDQVCNMKLGSWAYDGFQVDVVNNSDSMDLSNYVDNGEWELLAATAVRSVKYYGCCPEPFPDVTFWIHLRRRTAYYSFNVIIPCAMLSILTLGSFLLPAESGEKVSLGLTVLLAFSVFMLLIAENMPATSEFVPLIGVYLTVVMAMTSLSVVFSVFILHLHHLGERGSRAPRWLRRLAISWLARVVCIRTQKHLRWDQSLGDLREKLHPGFGSFNEGFKVPVPPKNVYKVENGQLHLHISEQDNKHLEQIAQNYQRAEQELMKYLRVVMERHEREELHTYMIKEWEDIAAVFDRLLFWLFFSLTLSTSLGLLVIKPATKSMLIMEEVAKQARVD